MRPAFLCLALFIGWCVFMLATLPIVYVDSDVWIHLSGGQYLAEHHHVPRDSYFSFLTPPRPWNSYAWLFQWLAYSIYSWTGPVGLILLRTLLYAATMLVVVRLLFSAGDRQCSRWLAMLAVLFAVLLLPRALNVRPHLFTYFFIPVFLYVLECRPVWVKWLPVLGLLWCNLHGIAYPVMLLICGAYSLDYVTQRLGGRPREARAERTFFVPVVLTMVTIFLTPLGSRLLEAPFRPITYLSGFINEMRPITWDRLTTFEVTHGVPKHETFFSVAAAMVLFSGIAAVSRRRLRVSHAVLLVGAVALLSRGQRFMSEFLLLSLPVLRAHPISWFDRAGEDTPRPVNWAIGLMALALPVMFTSQIIYPRLRYPVSSTGLPEGVGVFLRRLPAGGKVLNPLNSGGYLRWVLYPQYRLFMDMDSYFSDEDFYRGARVFTDATILRQFLMEHDPSFIVVPISAYVESFRELQQRFPYYEAVFFDDTSVVYINQRHYPELAQQYRLRTLDPHEIFTQDVHLTIADSARNELLLNELHRLLDIYPDGGVLNNLAGLIFNRQGAYDRGFDHANRIIRHFPESPTGYLLKAEALKGLGRPREALAAYRLARRRTNKEQQADLTKQMGLIYMSQGEYARAYHLFTQSIDMFALETSLEDLYVFGMAALQARKTPEAYGLFSYMAQFRIPEEDTVWRSKVDAILNRLEPPGATR